MGKLTGLLREITGALTGDRRTEARGRAEERAAERGTPVTDESLARNMEEVRKDHGDVPLREDPPSEWLSQTAPKPATPAPHPVVWSSSSKPVRSS